MYLPVITGLWLRVPLQYSLVAIWLMRIAFSLIRLKQQFFLCTHRVHLADPVESLKVAVREIYVLLVKLATLRSKNVSVFNK